MSPFPLKSRALALVSDINLALETGQITDPGSRASVLDKISTLRDTLETPLDSVLRILQQPQQNAALRIAVELGLLSRLLKTQYAELSPDQLSVYAPENDGSHPNETPRNMTPYDGFQPNGIITDQDGIASYEKLNKMDLMNDGIESINGGTNCDPQLIVRLMRVLTAMGVCDEVGHERYTSNSVTEAFAQSGLEEGVKVLFDMEIPAMAKLNEFFKATESKNPETHSPFEYAFGSPNFTWLVNNPQYQSLFNSYMSGRRKGKENWLDFYPVKENLIDGASGMDDTVFCVDIGGGSGHDLEQLNERFPSLPGKLVLQDLAETIRSLEGKPIFEIMIHDFFGPQPIKEARVYNLRAVLHDWPTIHCRTILSHIAAAMKPGYSRLIIREFVLADTGNRLLGAYTDMRMMILLAGLERTESQWRQLLDDVGLTVVGFWVPLRGGEGVIEAVKKVHDKKRPFEE